MNCETVLSNKCPDHTEKKKTASPKVTFFLDHSSSISTSKSPRRTGMSKLQQATRFASTISPCREKNTVDCSLFIFFLEVEGQCRQKHRGQTGVGSADRCAVPANLPFPLASLSFLEAGAVRVCCRSVDSSTTLEKNSHHQFCFPFFDHLLLCDHFRGLGEERGGRIRLLCRPLQTVRVLSFSEQSLHRRSNVGQCSLYKRADGPFNQAVSSWVNCTSRKFRLTSTARRIGSL